MKRKWLIAVVLILVVGLLIWANLRQVSPGVAASTGTSKTAPKNAQAVKVAPVQSQDLTQTVLAPGYLDSTDLTQVRAPFTTLRAHLLVGLGDSVSKGQTIAELYAGDLALQAVGEEAQLARAEAALAQLEQQRKLAPLQLAQRVEAARAQVVQAEAALAAALRQSGATRQQLQQAQASLVAAQARLAGGDGGLSDLRQRLQEAEAQYRADPLSREARDAYDKAEKAYADAQRQTDEAARQMAADLVQAQQAVEVAGQELTALGGGQGEGRGTGGEAIAAESGTGQEAQARAALDSAKAALVAVQHEVEAGDLTEQQLRSATADVAAARATLAATREKLRQASIAAPFDGRILSLALRDGEPVQMGQLILEVGKLNLMTVKARVDEVDIGKVNPGQTLMIKANAYPDEQFEGVVTRVAVQAGGDPRAAQSPGTSYQVEGEVANSDGRLLGGMNAEVTIIVESLTNVLAIGLEAIREEGGQASVLVVEGFKVEVRPVELGLRTQTHVQVLDGLHEGEQVVVSPFTLVRSLKNGDPVRAEPADEEQGASQPADTPEATGGSKP